MESFRKRQTGVPMESFVVSARARETSIADATVPAPAAPIVRASDMASRPRSFTETPGSDIGMAVSKGRRPICGLP